MSFADELANVDRQQTEELEELAEFGARHLKGAHHLLVSLVAGGWSVFQLLLPQFLLLSSEYVRCIHLAFAISLVFLTFPALKSKGKLAGKAPGFLSQKLSIPAIDYLLSILSAVAALYLVLDYTGVSERQGIPSTRDLLMGITLVVLLLEAARRSLGPALPIIAGSFILYSFVSQYMPDIIAFKNASLTKVVNKLTLSTEGIYGVPLDVSATTVFLFVLFGVMLERAGGGHYFIQLAFSLMGKYKGGPAKAAVLASGLTGMVSGSSIANTVTTGTFTIPLMKKSGYPGVKAGAIEVAASTNGQLMPPIMGAAAFIIAEYCNVTYFEVIRAAFVPAIISYVTLIYITHLEASKLGLKGIPKADLPQFTKVLIQGWHFLIPLVFLLYQLIIMRRSPQLSVYYAIIALAGLILVQRIQIGRQNNLPISKCILMGITELGHSLVLGGRGMMAIGVAVATAGIIVGMVTMGLGAVITDLIGLISGGNLVLLLIITAFVSLILGMGLPTTANYIVMASLTVPVILTLGQEAGLVIPLIAAHLFCFYFGILADDTPPVCLAAYAAAAISKEDPIRTGIQGFTYDLRTAILPFMFIFNTDLLLIGIQHWWDIFFIFATGLIAMFSFASLTQNFLIKKNTIIESMLLLCVSIVLLRPDLFFAWFDLNRWVCYGIGTLLFFLTFGVQRLRKA